MIVALASVAGRIARDESLGQAAAARDLGLRATLARHRTHPARQLSAWAQATSEDESEDAQRLRSALWSISAALALVGLALGAGTAGVLFHYDGGAPVNVTRVLWILVAAQLVLLVALVLAWLPRRLLRSVPPLDAFVRLLSVCNPGALWRLAARFLPKDVHASMLSALAGGMRHERLHGEVYRWQLMRWSQVVALAFQVGVVAVFSIKLATQDIAFAWSTQVEPVARSMPRVTAVLSRPWAAAWPAASPSHDFVQATRYARLRGGEFVQGEAPDAVTLGQWWPFLVGCLLLYGVAPRIATWAYCAYRTRRAAMWSIVRLPGADLVLQRLNEPQVQTAQNLEQAVAWRSDADAKLAALAPSSSPQVFVNWSLAPAHALPFPVALTEHMGGRNSPQDDDRALTRVCTYVKSGAAAGVVVGVRAWEVPTEALFDVLRTMRASLDAGPVITVLPLQAQGEVDRSAQWAAHASRVGDPWLRVAVDPDDAVAPPAPPAA